MSGKPSRRVPLALLMLTAGAARSQSNPSQGPIIHTETRVVLVEAIVTGKRGEYVRDLTAKDFRIWQDGKEQAITSLSVQAKATDPHFLVLFFDDTRMTAQDQSIARQAASRFIDANASPGRSMAVVSYNGAMRVAQNFTDSAGRLKDALNRVEASSNVTTISKLERASNTSSASDNFGSRNMLESLANLTKGLGALPGRKTVVFLTGGLPTSSELKSLIASAIESSSRSGVAIYPVNVRAVSVDPDASTSNPQARAPRGGRGPQGAEDSPRTPDPSAESQQLLQSLAGGTGGFLIRDSSELLTGLQRIGDEQTEYYVLGYTPPESKDGSCHALRVKVDRGGASVRARSSYCATKPVDLIAGTPAAKNLETHATGEETGNLRASMQLPYFHISPGVARVQLAMEIPPESLKFETSPAQNKQEKLHAEINLLGIATAADGSVGARFSDTIKLDFDSPAEFERLKRTPVHYEKQFKIAPGKYTFVLAFGSGGSNFEKIEAFGKIQSPLAVEPWSTEELTLSSVALSRETHPAADLGLLSALVEDRTPLIAASTQFVPFGSTQFAKSDNGFFYLEVYDPDPSSVSVRVRVLDRKTEETKWDSGLTKLPVPSSGDKSLIPAGAGLRLSTLGSGTYQLEITASDSAGKQVKRIADFDVK